MREYELGWFQNQLQEAAQALGAPAYKPANGTEQMLASLSAMVATLAAQMNERDTEWARSREEARAAAAAQQTQIAAYIEETLEHRMVSVKRYVSSANATAVINAGRGRRRQTSPTVSSIVPRLCHRGMRSQSNQWYGTAGKAGHEAQNAAVGWGG